MIFLISIEVRKISACSFVTLFGWGSTNDLRVLTQLYCLDKIVPLQFKIFMENFNWNFKVVVAK
jgi:hypothetical protein